MRRAPGSEWLAAVAAVAMIAAPPAPSRAGAVPDSAQMSGLRAATAKAPVLLVRGDFGLREIRDAILDSTGVRSARWESASLARPAVFTAPGQPPASVEPSIAWSRISSLQTQHQQKTKYALFGAVTGIAAAMLIYGMSDTSANTGEELPPAAAWALSAPMLGAFGGFLIGTFTGTRTVYPPPSQENP